MNVQVSAMTKPSPAASDNDARLADLLLHHEISAFNNRYAAALDEQGKDLESAGAELNPGHRAARLTAQQHPSRPVEQEVIELIS